MRFHPLTLFIAPLCATMACNLGIAQPIATPAPPAALPPAAATPTAGHVRPVEAPTPTPAALPIPDAPLSTLGPWLLVAARDGLWALNPDGSGLTHAVETNAISSLAVAPGGGRVAFITSAGPNSFRGLKLNLLTLPSGLLTVTALTSPQTEVGPELQPGDPNLEAAQAITDLRSLAWSPDGGRLAFVGAQDGPSADLYTYSADDGRIVRLTDGPSQAYNVSWSPDGRYVLQAGVSTFGTGAGYGMEGVWAARADDSGVKTLYRPQSGDELYLGWTAPDTFLVYSFRASCSVGDLRAVSLETGAAPALWPGFFDTGGVARDPASGSIVLSVDEFVAGCNPDRQPGVFIIPRGQGAARLIGGLQPGQVTWSAEAGLFLITNRQAAQAVTPEGDVVSLPALNPAQIAASPGGQMWAWTERGANQLLVGASGQPPRRVHEDVFLRPFWTPDGRALFFFGGEGHLFIARTPEFAPAPIPGTQALDVVDYPYPMFWVNP